MQLPQAPQLCCFHMHTWIFGHKHVTGTEDVQCKASLEKTQSYQTSKWQTSCLHWKATQAWFNVLQTHQPPQVWMMSQRPFPLSLLLTRVISGLLNGQRCELFYQIGQLYQKPDIYSSTEVLQLLSLAPPLGGRMGSKQTSSARQTSPFSFIVSI